MSQQIKDRMKQTVKNSLSRVRQTLRLPHDRTPAQIRKIKAEYQSKQIDARRIELIAETGHASAKTVQGFVDEIESHHSNGFPDSPDWDPGMMSPRDCISLYALVRALRPTVCVETGVGVGCSSMHILTALDKNGVGELHSIDLHGPNADQYGVIIPQSLRGRWDLNIQHRDPVLPELLKDLKEIDLFVHDSNHTFRHMTWEYELSWGYIKPGGVLASHDVDYTTAFADFLSSHMPEASCGGVIGNFGFLVKKQ